MTNTIRVAFVAVICTILLCNCSKEKEGISCEQKMIEQFGSQVSCSAKRGLDAHDIVLAKGSYNGDTIYFMHISCPACNTIAPQEGYKCGKDFKIEKIKIEDFNNNVREITVVKGCD